MILSEVFFKLVNSRQQDALRKGTEKGEHVCLEQANDFIAFNCSLWFEYPLTKNNT